MISIVIPTFNRAKVIKRTLDSIYVQKYEDWECLIVDDYSSDDTEETVKHYTKKDSRFLFIKNTRKKGAQGARNTGILAAKGEWIVLFDSDNVMKESFLLEISRMINKEYEVINTWSNVLDSTTSERLRGFKWVNNGDIHKRLLTGKCYVDNSSTAIRRSLLFDIGLLAEDCPAFQEWDTHLRISKLAKYFTIEKYLVDYYSGAADSISSDRQKDVKGYIYILDKFRNMWLREAPFHFMRYCATMKLFLDNLNEDQRLQYTTSYKEVVGIYKPVVNLLTLVLKFKQKTYGS